ncbi:hypothetical protein MRX96_046318 [Rhipicephalus microplus]
MRSIVSIAVALALAAQCVFAQTAHHNAMDRCRHGVTTGNPTPGKHANDCVETTGHFLRLPPVFGFEYGKGWRVRLAPLPKITCPTYPTLGKWRASAHRSAMDGPLHGFPAPVTTRNPTPGKYAFQCVQTTVHSERRTMWHEW